MSIPLTITVLGKLIEFASTVSQRRGAKHARIADLAESLGIHAAVRESVIEGVRAAARKSPGACIFEGGCSHYQEFDLDILSDARAVGELRRELNTNIELARERASRDPVAMRRELLGVFHQWSERFASRFPPTKADLADISGMKELVKVAHWKQGMARWGWVTSLTLAVLALLKAVMLAFCLGVGLIVTVKALLFGIPFMTVASLVGVAFLLGMLGDLLRQRSQGNEEFTAAVNMAYAMLDRRAGRRNRVRAGASRAT